MERARKNLKELPKKKQIREFHLPKLDFTASEYWKMVKIKFREMNGPYNPPKEAVFDVHTINYKGPTKQQPLSMPPIMAHMSAAEVDEVINARLTADFECHTQSCERGVAQTAESVKRRRTAATQLRMALSTVAAREETPRNITVKRFKNDFSKFTN